MLFDTIGVQFIIQGRGLIKERQRERETADPTPQEKLVLTVYRGIDLPWLSILL